MIAESMWWEQEGRPKGTHHILPTTLALTMTRGCDGIIVRAGVEWSGAETLGSP